MDFDSKGIATGDTKEDKKQRKQFIIDFYGEWIIANPEKRLYNQSLNAFIEVRFLSLEETAGHASLKYKSTVAVTFFIRNNRKRHCSKRPKGEYHCRNAKAECEKSVAVFKIIHHGTRKGRLRENKADCRRTARQRTKNPVLHYCNRKQLNNPRRVRNNCLAV